MHVSPPSERERERERREARRRDTDKSEFHTAGSSQVKVRENKKEETLLMHQVVNIDL